LNETVEGIESFDAGIVENESGSAGIGTLTVNVAPLVSHFFNGTLRNGDGVGIDGTLALTKTPGVMLLLHEHDTTFRQIFMDGAAVARGSFPDMTHTPVVGAMR